MKYFLILGVLCATISTESEASNPFSFEEISPSYVSWTVKPSTQLLGDSVLVIFGPENDLSIDAPNINKWLRGINDEFEVYLPSSEQPFFLKLCDFDSSKGQCLAESNIISTASNNSDDPVQNDSFKFVDASHSYVSWTHSIGENEQSGDHVVFMYSLSPDIQIFASDVTSWIRPHGEPGEAYLSNLDDSVPLFLRLCDFSTSLNNCLYYSDEIKVQGNTSAPIPPTIPSDPQTDNIEITGIYNGYIAWRASELVGDTFIVYSSNEPGFDFGDSGVLSHDKGPSLTNESWISGNRFVRICQFDYENSSCISLSHVYDTFFPDLDSYPDNLTPMLVPMDMSLRTPSPYEGVVVENYPIDSDERHESLPSVPEGTFDNNPNLYPDSGRFYYECGISHIGYDDPIVFYGHSGVSHLHMFLGNTNTDAWTTTQTLFDTTTPSTCRGNRLNRSAYWVPAIFDSNHNAYIPDTSEFMFINYSTGVDPANMQVFPQGFRMIAGNAMTQGPQSIYRHSWSCASNPAFKSEHVAACSVGDVLIMQLVFPQCWDGVNVDSPNQRDHMAYPEWDPLNLEQVCPTSRPVVLPEIRFDILFEVPESRVGEEGNTSDWYLASDSYDLDSLPGGYSIHGDFMNAWDETMLNRIITECIAVQGTNCNNSTLPDDVEMIQRTRGPQTINPSPDF